MILMTWRALSVRPLALAHTAPLGQLCREGRHSRECVMTNGRGAFPCAFCIIERHIAKALGGGGGGGGGGYSGYGGGYGQGNGYGSYDDAMVGRCTLNR